MVKPITARVNCGRCNRRVRLPEPVVAELAYRLAIETGCPECGEEIKVSLLPARAVRRPGPVEQNPIVATPPAAPAPPAPPVELPFRALAEVKPAAPLDVPFAPMRLDSAPVRGGRLLGWWMRIPVAHRATWIAAAIVVTVALFWPGTETRQPGPPTHVETRR